VANRRVAIALTLTATCLLAFALTFLLLKSVALASAACAGLVGITVIFVQPFVGLVNYLLFLYLRPQDYVPGLVGAPIMLAIGGATVALFVLHMAVQKRQIRVAHAPQNWLMLWLYGAIVVSVLVRMVPADVIDAVTEFGTIMIMYFLISNLVDTPRRFGFIIKLLFGLTLALGIQGVVQYFTGTGLGGQETYEGRIQAVGIFSDPNDLGLALVMVMPYAFLKLFERTPLWERALTLATLALLSYALFLTQSRGGLMAFGALLMILLSRRMGKVLGYGLGGVGMLAIFVLGPRMSSISTGEASAYGRIQAWGIGIDLFESYPLFGVGYRNFTEYHFRTAHNSFVLCAAELGAFGLYAWVMIIYLSIKNCGFIANELRVRGQRRFAVYVETIRFSLIAYCLGAYWLSRTYNEMLFIMVGLSTAATQLFVKASAEKYSLIEKKDFLYGFLCMIGAWLATKLFLYAAW
jgi:O-Antigen ligase